MTMSVVNLLQPNIPKLQFQQDYVFLIDSYLTYLREHYGTNVVEVDPTKARVFYGDFYGFLQSRQISPEHWYLLLRLNKMTHPIQFDENLKQIIVPEDRELNIINIMHRAVGTIKF